MKFYKLFILIISALILQNTMAQQSNIYAVVEGYFVNIWEKAAYRNCGALYRMDIDRSDNQINWYQVDTGLAAFCLCHFDLSVTYGPLEPGNYHVSVFYTESYSEDTLYSGSTEFIIEPGNGPKYSGVISQYQSDCYTVGMADKVDSSQDVISIYPIPWTENRILTVDLPFFTNSAHLELFNATGELIYSKYYSSVKEISLNPFQDLKFLKEGFIFLRLQTPRAVYSAKIIVF